VDDELVVLTYLWDNVEHICAKIEPIKNLKEMSFNTVPQIFHDDVISQYHEAIRKLIAEDIATHTNVNPETIITMVSDINLKEAFNV
jgi:hypothetical protein